MVSIINERTATAIACGLDTKVTTAINSPFEGIVLMLVASGTRQGTSHGLLL